MPTASGLAQPGALLIGASRIVEEMTAAEVPAGRRGAVRVTATQAGARIAGAARVGRHVTIGGWAERAWGVPGWRGAAEVQIAWE